MTKKKTDGKEEYKERRVVYCGRRTLSNNKSSSAYALEEDPSGELNYTGWGSGKNSIIGQIYTVQMTDSYSMKFSTLADTGESMPDRVEQWAIEDATARRARQNESARKKLEAERKESWIDCMRPLRVQYRQLPAGQRRAMRQLVVEWLEE